MKTFTTILKILAVLAAIAGIVFVVIKYGDKISAWCQKMLQKLNAFFCKNRMCVPTEEGEAADEDFATAD